MELWCVESLGMQASKTGLVGVRITRCRAKLMWECALSWFAKVHVVRDYMYSMCLSTATCTCTRVVRVLYPRQRDNRCHDLSRNGVISTKREFGAISGEILLGRCMGGDIYVC